MRFVVEENFFSASAFCLIAEFAFANAAVRFASGSLANPNSFAGWTTSTFSGSGNAAIFSLRIYSTAFLVPSAIQLLIS
jgi:hypothetical protein